MIPFARSDVLAALIALMIGAIIGMVAMSAIQTVTGPHCPTEDSCHMECHNKSCVIKEDAPTVHWR